MRPEARDEFLRSADATAKQVGGESFHGGIVLIRSWLPKLTELLDSVRTPEMLAQLLDETEMSIDNERLMLALAGFGPQLVRWIFAKLSRNAEATLPNFSNRRPAIAASVQIEMLQFINDLHFNQGLGLQDVKGRAARRFGCKVRTVERYWRERKEILANGPKLQFADLIDGIKVAIEADK